MQKFQHFLFLLLLTGSFSFASAQSGKIDSARFFMDEKPIELTLSSDLKTLLGKRNQRAYQPATVTIRFADSTSVTEEIRIQPRGKFRLENCYMPPLYLNFKNKTSPKTHSLGKIKLVCGCATGSDDEQLIIKEFLSYKIYNMLTPKSFRVRLAKVNYEDTRGKVKKYSQYGFLLEDVDDMAARNKCKEVEGRPFNTESTDRQQMTLVAIFEYMIGNSDWSVPNYHNIKLMRPVTDSVSLPYAVPYDLNHSGLVNASYAVPPEELGTKSVTERVYRGFPRSMEELEEVIDIFKSKKDKTLSLIKNCEWLNARYKKEVTNFLEDFYKTIDSKSSVKNVFITNARTQ
jgi:hypothetical protein